MASFKILVIISQGLTFTLNDRTGFYTSNDGQEKGIYDFLETAGINVINTVIVGENRFSLGDNIANRNSVNTSLGRITRFSIVRNVVHAYIGDNSYLLTSVTAYVPPVTVIPAETQAVKAGELKNTTRLQEIEDQIIAQDHRSVLKLDTTHTLNNQSLEDFLINFLRNYNTVYRTVYASGTREGDTQTSNNRRRSIGDIFKICRYYYPDCKLVDLAHILYGKHLATGKLSFVGTLKCRQINKRVWWNNLSHRISDELTPDEYGMTISQWKTEIARAYEVSKTKPVVKFKPTVGDYVIANETSNTITKNYQYTVLEFNATEGKVKIESDRNNEVWLPISEFSPSYLEQAKIKFPKGSKIKTPSGNTVTVDTTNFQDTGRNIIQISSAGGRRIVYSKENSSWAKKI
jgi:uncharacterized protein (UPF0297 family)